MSKIINDPFGGIIGETSDSASPFKIDKDEAIKDIEKSIIVWGKKKSLKDDKSQRNLKPNALHWEFSKSSKSHFNIHLVWSKNIIRTLGNVPLNQVKLALESIKNFYGKISGIKPDLSNPYILACYNQTAKNYNLPQKNIKFKEQIEVNILNPFAGIQGEDLNLISNDLSKDKHQAIEEINLSFECFNQLDVIEPKKTVKSNKKKPKNFSFSYKTSTDYFDIHLSWAGKIIKSTKKVPRPKARLALMSLRSFIKSFNTQNPDLNDSNVKLMYEASKLKHKPGKGKNSPKELLSKDEGGRSYWSYKTHRWIKGKFNKKTNAFIPPKKDL